VLALGTFEEISYQPGPRIGSFFKNFHKD